MESLNNKDYKILIIEDDPKTAQLIGLLLRDQDFVVMVATGGEDALGSGQVEKVDLILLDINLPGINGLEVCKRLKSSKSTLHTPVIFLTSESDQKKKIEGFRVGAADYVCKPFNDLELLARINTHLALKAYREQLVRDAEVKVKVMAHGILSHEVFNPLTSIIGNLEVIETGLKNEGKEGLMKYIRKAKEASMEIVEKVDQLKTFKDVTAHDFGGLSALLDEDE